MQKFCDEKASMGQRKIKTATDSSAAEKIER